MFSRLEQFASWSARRPWRALALWLIFVVGCLALGAASGTKSLDNGATGESARGYDLGDHYGLWGFPTEAVLVQGNGRASVARQLRAQLADTGGVGKIHGPLRSADGRSVLVYFDLHRDVVDRLETTVATLQRSNPGAQLGLTGDISVERARDDQNNRDLSKSEKLSLPIALAVLFVVFGALVAASVPVVLALTAVAAALGLVGPLSQAFAMDDAAKTVLVLIGMAVGVDYSLFYIARYRQELRGGASTAAALTTTARTSGHTIIVSGLTVAAALAGLFIAGETALSSVAVATIAVVLCAVAGSLTVLPAVLSLLGPRIDRGRLPGLGKLEGEEPSRFWQRVVDAVLRRPKLAAGASTALLLALAVPALSLHTSKPSDTALASQKLPAIATLNKVQHAFPGGSEPADLIVAGPRSESQRIAAAIASLHRRAVASGLIHEPVNVLPNKQRSAALMELPLTGKGDNAPSRRAVALLRKELVPQAFAEIPGVTTAVTGKTAEDIDFTAQIRNNLPYVIGFVLVLAFVLLLFAFRSLVVPLKAIVLNLLSVGAAYGVLVLVFQHHWAEGLLGFKSDGAVISWLPLFLFVILFGLSMDYHVFILSRVRELVDRGETTEQAVRDGIARTAGVVTGAALVMVGVFGLFGAMSSLALKQAGVGLATAVVLDATIVRAVLLPASMKLLGEWNWYLPRPIARRLPNQRPSGMPLRPTVKAR
jgi:RND superfamily putative drug exporter